MPNEKVSQLTVLTANQLASEDVFLVGDLSAHESKQITSEQLLLYFESSGSFNASTATVANTASYILGSNVDGIVDSSSYSLTAVSSSHALRANVAITASYFSSSVATFSTASYLLYTGGPNGTASYAVNSLNSVNATNTSNLVYVGVANGTASYSISGSYANTAGAASSSFRSLTSSYSATGLSSSYSNKSTLADTASYTNLSSVFNPVKAWAQITWSVGPTIPLIHMQYNVSEVRYISVTTAAPWSYYNFGVYFTTQLTNTTYSFIGNAYAPPGTLDIAYAMCIPEYTKYVEGFTMSVVVSTDVNNPTTDWFVHSALDQPNVVFQVLGAP